MAEEKGREGGPPKVAVALDFPDRDRALALVDHLEGGARLFKVGLELFTRAGSRVVADLRDRGLDVFLDLKLHDIPNTVSRAVAAGVGIGAELLTVHATGGPAMIRAAREAAEGSGTRVLAVTVLTSLDSGEISTVRGAVTSPREEVARLATLAWEAGAHGMVASAAEAALLRSLLGPDVLIVTPGIRLAGDDVHDQARVTTPGDAVRAGADVLVVGRSVTAASDPREALERIRSEMEEARSGEGSLQEATP